MPRLFDELGNPLYLDWAPGDLVDPKFSPMPFFPGYSFTGGKSSYKNVNDVGEGGRVFARPGIYRNVVLLDIASMHPSSIIAENMFGPYTKRFREIVMARVYIKRKQFDEAKKLLDGKLAPYLEDEQSAGQLAQALKIAINSVYGLTAAHFDNPFHDPRNKDNLVAKRGALFMINLQEEVEKRGFIVAHIKTDSIKIPNATDDIIKFVMDYGKEFGYEFEHEATYDRMCLVNDAVYIAKYDDKGIRNKGGKHANDWTATGTQFQIPYVFKTLFSHEPIVFEDMCETKSVTSNLYLDYNEGLGDEHSYKFIGKVSSFCPVIDGVGGGKLVREVKKKDGNIGYDSAVGCKDYRWLESKDALALGMDAIDISYYRRLVDEAQNAINQYGDFFEFVEELG